MKLDKRYLDLKSRMTHAKKEEDGIFGTKTKAFPNTFESTTSNFAKNMQAQTTESSPRGRNTDFTHIGQALISQNKNESSIFSNRSRSIQPIHSQTVKSSPRNAKDSYLSMMMTQATRNHGSEINKTTRQQSTAFLDEMRDHKNKQASEERRTSILPQILKMQHADLCSLAKLGPKNQS